MEANDANAGQQGGAIPMQTLTLKNTEPTPPNLPQNMNQPMQFAAMYTQMPENTPSFYCTQNTTTNNYPMI